MKLFQCVDEDEVGRATGINQHAIFTALPFSKSLFKFLDFRKLSKPFCFTDETDQTSKSDSLITFSCSFQNISVPRAQAIGTSTSTPFLTISHARSIETSLPFNGRRESFFKAGVSDLAEFGLNARQVETQVLRSADDLSWR